MVTKMNNKLLNLTAEKALPAPTQLQNQLTATYRANEHAGYKESHTKKISKSNN